MSYPYRYAPGAEIYGAAATAIFNHFRRESVLESLQRYNMDELEEDQWYPVDQILNVLADWFQQPSTTANLVSVGMALTYHLEMTPDQEKLDTLSKLLLLGDLHMAQHRGQGAGSYQAEQVGPTHIVYSQDMVWPDDMIYGYIYGAARRFLPEGTHFVLRYDPDEPRQDEGGSRTILHLTWEG